MNEQEAARILYDPAEPPYRQDIAARSIQRHGWEARPEAVEQTEQRWLAAGGPAISIACFGDHHDHCRGHAATLEWKRIACECICHRTGRTTDGR